MDGKGLWEWAGAEMLTSGSRGRGWPQRATGGEDMFLESAVPVVERWMGHRAVRGLRGLRGHLAQHHMRRKESIPIDIFRYQIVRNR